MREGMQSFRLYRGRPTAASTPLGGVQSFLCEVCAAGFALAIWGMMWVPCCGFGARESELSEMEIRRAEIEAAIEEESLER